MKNSIARKVTRRVSLLLLLALAVLFIGSLMLVSNVIYKANQRYATAIVGIYSDLLVDESNIKQIPIDDEHTDNIIRYGEYICDWYNVDYVYIYIPDIESGTVTYIAAAYADSRVSETAENNMIGYELDHVLSPEELAVWNGEKLLGQTIRNDSYGHEVGTILRIEDCFGNRAIVGVEIAYANIVQQVVRAFATLALIIMAVLAGIYCAVYLIVRKQVSRPAQHLSRSMQDFITDGKCSSVKLDMDKESPDEYQMIAGAFNSMTDNICAYLENINKLTRQQEHQQTELEIASRIQRSFLPEEHFFSLGYEITAVMNPAKNVGGDLYDYMPLDDDRVLLVIADVSGKGIAAAMFMSIIMTLIRQFAKMDLSPAEILRRTNEAISEKNSSLMFATAFLGIYDTSSKCFTYANAGHNIPYVVGRKLRALDEAGGALLGLFRNEEYSQANVQLIDGDMIFLYTDGVSEAADCNHKFYGTERLENALREFRTSHSEDPIAFIRTSILDFASGAEQHDDITMLTMSVNSTKDMLLNVDIGELSKIKAAVLDLPISRSDKLSLCLAAEESFVNICSYGFPDREITDERIRFTLTFSDKVVMRFEDGGNQFNQLEFINYLDDYDIDSQTGGLGRYIAASITDDAKYEYTDNKNILTFTKYIEEENI